MKKNYYNGFTLIELLAVVVLLGIVTLIAYASISNHVEKSRNNAVKADAITYIKRVEDLSELDVAEEGDFDEGTFTVEQLEDYVHIKGRKPIGGSVVIVDSEVTTFCLEFDNNRVARGNGTNVTFAGKGICVDAVIEFAYEGQVIEYKIKKTGNYKLEVWGAQGGSQGGINPHVGGYGGFSTGIYHFTKGQNIYIGVGKEGEWKSNGESAATFGGGGAGYSNGSSNYTGSGGGASWIALENRGSLSNYDGHLEELIIIAGGGGGAVYNTSYPSYFHGSSGGGSSSMRFSAGNTNRTKHIDPLPATQENGGTYGANYNSSYSGISDAVSIGTFGLGGTYSAKNSNTYVAGGGGGLYGGSAGYLYGGMGGSGYIGNQDLSSKHMYGYYLDPDDTPSSYTISEGSSSCHNEEPTYDCAKEKNGFVRLTYQV